MSQINKQFTENLFLKSFETQKKKPNPVNKKKKNGYFVIDDSKPKNQMFNMTKQ